MLALRNTGKEIYQLMSENFFYSLALNWYSKKFWELAFRRPEITSNPLSSMFLEMKRIELFQESISRDEKRWSEENFYNLWDALDRKFIKIRVK